MSARHDDHEAWDELAVGWALHALEPEDEALFIAEFAGETGRLAPRNLLASQLERAAAMGLAVTAGLEYEFFILEETPASVRASRVTTTMAESPPPWRAKATTWRAAGPRAPRGR